MNRHELKRGLMTKDIRDLNDLARSMKRQIRHVRAQHDTWPVADLMRSLGDGVSEILVDPNPERQKENVVDAIIDGAYWLQANGPADEELDRMLS